MAKSNRQRIDEAIQHLSTGLTSYVRDEMNSHYGDGWLDSLNSGLTREMSPADAAKSEWDPYVILKAMWDHWNAVFSKRLSRADRNYVSELQGVRNDHAHNEKFSYDDTERALDTTRRLLADCGAVEQAEAVAVLRKDAIRTQQAEEARSQVRKVQALEGTPEAGLKPWREVIAPHTDVASGRYSEAEFVASLTAVHQKKAPPEYSDAGKFFERTFMTEGLRELLRIGIRRLTGNGGDPVVQLKTNFGGGKTHSMLALYHLFGGGHAGTFAGMEELLAEEGVAGDLPTANRAVIVGIDFPPAETDQKPDGTVVHTMWGEIAWQLGGAEVYALVEDSDKNGTSPGQGLLEDVLRACSPCIVFIDEWVAFLRQLPGKENLPAGTEDANFTFAQALTEAVKEVPNALFVASLPVSDIEIGGEHGKDALVRLENVFKRVAKPWEPASSNEGFEIVRRRLFESAMDHAARDNVIKAFIEMYKKESGFPPGVKEEEYRKRLMNCYPIHPELFDRLDQDWSQLDRFQRTRGVLRLMSSVIHELWTTESNGLLIMPSMIPLEAGRVSSLFAECLPAGTQWKPVINRDIAGQESLPLQVDAGNPNFNKVSAARRVARSVFFGSAAILDSNNRGIDDSRIRLACAQPGENVNAFGDALRRLTDQAMHLYYDSGRYWYSLQPTVTRLAADLRYRFLEDAKDTNVSDIHTEIATRLRKEKDRGEFAAIHIAPDGPNDIEDDMKSSLIVLGPESTAGRKQVNSTAKKNAGDILESRGNSPRIHRNTLVFLAADGNTLEKLKEDIASYLAWKLIDEEKEERNLNAHAMKQALTKRNEFDRSADIKLRETWQWAMAPHQPDAKRGDIEWEIVNVAGQEALGVKTSKKLVTAELLVPALGPERLLMELDRYLWKEADHIEVKKVVEAFANYMFLPRLTKPEVIIQAIQRSFDGGSLLPEYFAYATSYDEDKGRYMGLQTTSLNSVIGLQDAGLLVKLSVAEAQSAADQSKGESDPGVIGSGDDLFTPAVPKAPSGGGTAPAVPGEGNEVPALPKRYFGEVEFDAMQAGASMKVSDFFREVITHLTNGPDNDVKVRLVIDATSPDGFDETMQRNVKENSKTLGGEEGSFE